MKNLNRKEGGFISVAIVLGLLILGLFAMSSNSVVNDSSTETANNTNKERANYYALAGIEYALRAIDQGQDPNGVKTFDMGSATLTINGNQITSVGKSDVAQVTRSITTAMSGSCVSMSCNNFHSNGKDLLGVYVSKACLSHPIIARMKVSFTPDNGEKVSGIQINSQSVYSDATGTKSGTFIDITDYTIPTTPSPDPVDFIRFSSNIVGAKSYTITSEYTDHTTSQVTCIDATAAQVCGNGIPETGEECDDGNKNNGDGCSSNCTVEPGYKCNGNPSSCSLIIPTPVCGNGAIEAGEACDDGNTNNGDGCSSTCQIENGFTCSGNPSVCAPIYVPVCGNGKLDQGEACDDANTKDGDGCSSTCTVESGYTCSGSPSKCTLIPPPASVCPNGIVETGESCDDGNSKNGDGCSSNCTVEPGYNCSGNPSVCIKPNVCGDGNKAGTEACDDGNTVNGDGCSSNCQIETGWACSGSPLSTCSKIPGSICGNGILESGEECDDGNVASNDGCSSSCKIEANYTCTGSPKSTCTPTIPTPVCGNGKIEAGEACDDGNKNNGDGCSSTCQIETDYACSGAPSVCDIAGKKYCICHYTSSGANPYNTISISENAVCAHIQQHGDIPGPCAGDTIAACKGAPPLPIDYPCLVSSNNLCGDGKIENAEACDDGNKVNGDGCSSNCIVESGYTCTGTPSKCTLPPSKCGNGKVETGEACDDGNQIGGDGCSANCTVEPNYTCTGAPSVCKLPTPVCGNGKLESGEACDDGNKTNGDGCSSTCTVEAGYACTGSPLSTCSLLCGNGKIDAGETCDDGNRTSGDGCSSTCQVEGNNVCTGAPSVCRLPIVTNASTGTVSVGKNCDSEIKVICNQITYGAGGPAIPVKMNRALNGSYFNNWMFSNTPVYEGEVFTESVASSAPAVYMIKANAKYGSFNSTYDSTNKNQTMIWVNGSNPPSNIAGFGGQKSLNTCLAPYIDMSAKKVKLAANESIITMELGVDVSQYPTSTAADFQDLTVLISAKNCK
ncbi:MAG: DUF4215 domain-containing protein [Deltaproteobacteria bacterium]|nr:DUF4215 domain-containing protein [Deltaproteobacteria bacterium]